MFIFEKFPTLILGIEIERNLEVVFDTTTRNTHRFVKYKITIP